MDYKPAKAKRISKSSTTVSTDWPGQPDIAPAPQATVALSFVESLAGLPAHDAAEMVKEKGFKPLPIGHGEAVAGSLMTNVLLIWVNEDGYTVKHVECSDPRQLVIDI